MAAQNETTINIRVTAGLKRACQAAAQRSQLTFSDWVRFVLVRAAHEGAFAPTGAEEEEMNAPSTKSIDEGGI